VTSKFHEFNDTRYRRIEYWLEATTRVCEFMTTNILTDPIIEGGGKKRLPTDERIQGVGEKVVNWVSDSGPPPAAHGPSVMPLVGWVRITAGGKQNSWRRGGGLRVYLDRPWNVSGYGEMLAVVLPSAAATGDPNFTPAKQPLKNYVTQWGNDPVWLSAGLI